MAHRILVTGCSGGGKSSLIECLSERGELVVREPGLRVIKRGGPKPWNGLAPFLEAATAEAEEDLRSTQTAHANVFFDRGLFDAVSGLAMVQGMPVSHLMPHPFPYSQPVFFAPPWSGIFERTPDRQHSFETACEEAERLRRDLRELGIRLVDLPKVSVRARAEFVLTHIS